MTKPLSPESMAIVKATAPVLVQHGVAITTRMYERLFVDEAVQFIERHRDRPFYINIWTLVPHATLHPTPEQLEKYARFAPARTPYHGATQIYYAAVTGLDEQLGTLFRRLDELGLVHAGRVRLSMSGLVLAAGARSRLGARGTAALLAA